MQHAGDHSVMPIVAAEESTAASDIPARPGGDAVEMPAAAAAATGSDGAADGACQHQQPRTEDEAPVAERTASEGGPSEPPFADGDPSAAAEERAAAELALAVGGGVHAPQITGLSAETTAEANREVAETLRSEEVAGSPEETEAGEHLPHEPKQTIPRLMGRQMWRPRGQRLSFGRLCKGNAASGGCVGDSAAAKKRWEQHQQQKEKQREARDFEKQARAIKEKVRVQRRKQREAKRQRKKENEMKSAKVQVIKDTTKIRKWNKQARRQLVKMSPEMIRQLYGVQL